MDCPPPLIYRSSLTSTIDSSALPLKSGLIKSPSVTALLLAEKSPLELLLLFANYFFRFFDELICFLDTSYS